MNKEIENALIPDTEIVKLADRTYEIKKISIKQMLYLGKFITSYLSKNREQMDVISKKFSDGNKSIIEDISIILELLDEKQIIELFSILLNEKDFEFIENNLDFDISLDIIIKVIDINKKSNVKKNFQKIMEMISNKSETGSPN